MAAFVDTNLFVYARDATEPEKQQRVSAWLRALWQSRQGRVSVQVLTEYYVTVTQKLKPGLSREQAWADLRNLAAWRPTPTTFELVEQAWHLQSRYQLSWWDALIIAAARATRCEFLLTEDLQDGQLFDSLRVVDPFRSPPEAVLAR